jgi:hypothetical protein
MITGSKIYGLGMLSGASRRTEVYSERLIKEVAWKAGQDLVEVRYYGMKDVTSVGCLLYIRACSYKVVGNVKPR